MIIVSYYYCYYYCYIIIIIIIIIIIGVIIIIIKRDPAGRPGQYGAARAWFGVGVGDGVVRAV